MYNFNINSRPPIYDPEAVQPMRDELTYTGFVEARTPGEVDKYITDPTLGTVFVMINSVCGCAAGSARPGVNLALQNGRIPDHLVTVFAGQDRDAVDRVRGYLSDFPPSSPSAALFKDGKLVYMMQRYDIEGYSPQEIAEKLVEVFNQFCTKEGPSISREDYAKLEYARACGSSIPRHNAN
ncbi:MAG: BrxA/BrxB family bacilliredoxin [Bacteroidota bacterium]|jgi:putative YphP/YqiW family bacilliredoxin|nr:BrxA/BrxB family bacilliredoxin [Ignavibacteria bacterium]HEX2961538.1 BrxA/BrxB family bacilliredoxin [Ignavibacteriales bacterium]MCU7498007.1 BrxA/BrxB family bacilliredoxin [Ignavibacteria bacterium]MCU7511706.1 BrxA/BrxB family bacilliredoxin [Ignavibacteria bacterium]MCU7519780.1 BrxA/BrxB family bacilliredoxin [Ignavibacteria bacterium]